MMKKIMEHYIKRAVDPQDLNDINDFLNYSRHRFSYEGTRYPIEYSMSFLNELADELRQFLELYDINHKTSLIIQFTSSLERSSEYVELNGKQIIVLDIHQIYECVDAIILTYLAELGSSSLLDGSTEQMQQLLSMREDIAEFCDKNGIAEEDFYEFLTQHEIDHDVIAPNYLHNLADLYFTQGYIDASVICLSRIRQIPVKDIEIDAEYAYVAELPKIIPDYISAISRFVVAHELNHIMINNHIINDKLQQKLLWEMLMTLFDKCNQEMWSDVWQFFTPAIRKRSKKYRQVIKNLIGNLIIDEDLKEKMDSELSDILSQWFGFDLNKITDADFEELYCDIEAINNINLYLNDRIEISFSITTIMKSLMIQETCNLQKNIILFLTGKTKKIDSNFITRIQMLFCFLTLICTQENMPKAFRELMLFKTMDFDDEHKKSLMKELSDALDLLHEVYYIPAIINAIDSFKTELVHKEINTIHFGRERKSIVLDEAEWGAQNADNDSKLSSIDFIVMQNEIMHLYLKYKAECFKNRK